MSTSNVRFGKGATREIGLDFVEMNMKHILVVTDSHLQNLSPVKNVLKSLDDVNLKYTVLSDQVKVEPTDVSIQQAIETAKKIKFDAIAAVGGGSVMDTAKAINLYTTFPVNDFFEYVNPPIGKGTPVPVGLKPLICIPTTAGTGSENTGVVIFDIEKMHCKTGIAHRNLKPFLGIVDPENTRELPREIAASTGFDVLCHAIESYTAIPYNQRPYPGTPLKRPAYQGSNPVSDTFSVHAIQMCAKYFKRACDNPDDEEARSQMLLAASYAAIGFGNAGVHLCHGMSYPVSGNAHKLGYHPKGFPGNESFVPHGQSVVLNAPAVFRFIASACPERCLHAAEILGANTKNVKDSEAGEVLANQIIEYMKYLNVPNGLNDIGYTTKDIPDLVKGTLPQHRVTKLSPKVFTEKDLENMFAESMKLW